MVEKKVKKPAGTKIMTGTKKTKIVKTVTNRRAESGSAVKLARKQSALTADVYGLTGNVVGSMELPKEIFGVKVNKALIAQAVRIYLANQRVGSASTKTRGEVQGSTRKIYRQKGTGRARHGGIRAPIFVHGGIAHGPKPRDFSLKLPQKMKRKAVASMLSAKAAEGLVKIVTGLEKAEGKTKQMATLLAQMHGQKKPVSVLLVLDKKHDAVVKAVRNIEGVTYDFTHKLHTYELLENRFIIFMKEAVDELKSVLVAKGRE